MDAKKELELLIQEGHEAKDKCISYRSGTYKISHISGTEYVTWIQKCKMFMKKNVYEKECL